MKNTPISYVSEVLLIVLACMLGLPRFGAPALGQSNDVSKTGEIEAGTITSASRSMGQEAPAASASESAALQPVQLDEADPKLASLARTVSVHLDRGTVEEALRLVARKADLEFAYLHRDVSVEKSVTLDADEVSVGEALHKVVSGTDLKVFLMPGTELIWIKREKTKVTTQGLQLEPVRLQSAALAPVVPQEQTGTIAGTVTDAESGEPLPGVNVVIEGTQQGAATGADGTYEITGVEAGTHAVTATFVGYADTTRQGVEVQADQTTAVDFALEREAAGLEEVVVVGYGQQQRRDLTGAVSSIDPEEAQPAPRTSVEQMLQGKAAGVEVTRTSGAPGGGISVRIRGTGSITANAQPLYVIDGVPAAVGSGSDFPRTNPLAQISPKNIASIEVLKGPSATAIYGSRGANGVVLITTERGSQGDRVLFEGSYGMQEASRTIPLLNARKYAELVNEARVNSGLEPYFSADQIAQMGEGANMQEEIFRPAPVQDYALTVSGGGDQTRYLVSGNVYDQRGIILNSGFRRYSGRVNLNREVSESFHVGNNLMLSRTTRDVAETGTSPNSGVVGRALSWAPTSPVRDSAGNYVQRNPFGSAFSNPVLTAKEVTRNRTNSRVMGNVFGEYDVTEALGLRVELGGDATFGRNEYYAPRSTPNGEATGGEAQVTSSQESQLVSRNILTYERGLGPGDLDFTGGFTAQTFRSEYASAEAQQFATDVTGPNSLGAGARPLSPGSGTNESTLLSWLGRANYSLMDKYLLTLTGRYDGSSKFGENDKWGFFPSGALAWRVSDEPFLQDVEALSNLKLRASYGITGNQEIGTYQSLSRLQSGSYVLGAQQVSTYTLASQAPNPDLKWERKQQFNAGLDLGLWRGRVSLTANVYSGTTRDLLLRVPLASATGFTSQLRNVGSVSNWGVEVSLNTINIQQGDFSWESSLSLSRNQNEVTGLGGQERIFPSVRGSYMVEGGTTSIVQVGEPLGSFFGFETEGIWQQQEAEAAAEFGAAPGDWKYIDQNGDGVISSDDRVILGSPQADFFGGLSNNFAFGPLTLDVFLQFRSGNNVVWMKSLDLNRSVGISNEFASVANRWQPDNPSNTVPRASLDRRRRLKDVNVEDGSFLRLKDVTLGYRLPAGTVPGVEGARLYVSGQDLWVGTDYSGYDPEVNSYGASPARRGIDLNAYPKARTVTVGASLTF